VRLKGGALSRLEPEEEGDFDESPKRQEQRIKELGGENTGHNQPDSGGGGGVKN